VPCTVVLPPEESEDEATAATDYTGGSVSYDQLDFAPPPSRQLRPHYHSTSTLRSRRGSRSPLNSSNGGDGGDNKSGDSGDGNFDRGDGARRSEGHLSQADMPNVSEATYHYLHIISF
jgi:hypothetical protein